MLESGWEQPHVEQVTRLALLLFDQAAPVLPLELTERPLLAAAALIHDSCYRTDRKEHHKAAYHLAVERLSGRSGSAVASVVGLIARYHRGALPTRSHGPFSRLSASEQRRVCQLASLLRIADGLDRTHEQPVVGLCCSFQPSSLQITVIGRGDLTDVLLATYRKGDLFTATFGRSLALMERRQIQGANVQDGD